MGLKSELFRLTITCDDPYRRNCHSEIRSHYSEEHIKQKAKKAGWYQSQDTDKWACSACISFHNTNIQLDTLNGKMTRDEADNSVDPFTAAFVIAFLVSMSGDQPTTQARQEPLAPGGGQFGGAGASGTFDEQPVAQVAEKTEVEAPAEVGAVVAADEAVVDTPVDVQEAASSEPAGEPSSNDS